MAATPLADRTSEVVIDRIKQLIAEGGLAPGDRLPTEHQLAERFGVSRITVREATKALRFLGILRSAPRRGLTVGRLDLDRLSRCLDVHLFTGGYDRHQLLRARLVIELGVMPYVAQRLAREPAIAERLLAWTELPGLALDPQRYIEADIAFHRDLIAASGIAPLGFFDDLLRTFFLRFRDEAVGPDPDAMAAGIRMHRRIVIALRDGQVAIAQDLLREAFEHYDEPAPDRPEDASTP